MSENPAGEERIPLEVLREALAQYTRASSLRRVAAHLGMGTSTLQRFITRGGSVQPRTRRSMETFCREVLCLDPGLEDEVSTALRVLTDHLPPTAVDRVREGIVAFVAAETLALGAELPGWMRDEE